MQEVVFFFAYYLVNSTNAHNDVHLPTNPDIYTTIPPISHNHLMSDLSNNPDLCNTGNEHEHHPKHPISMVQKTVIHPDNDQLVQVKD